VAADGTVNVTDELHSRVLMLHSGAGAQTVLSEAAGVITTLMRPWVDKIKKVGNEANHELLTMSSEEAKDVAEFTRQLIRLAYELPAMVAEHAPAEAGAAVSGDAD
jgi:hypothetical protein